MNHKMYWVIFISLSLTILLMMESCASAPDVEEPIIVNTVEEEDVVNEPVTESPAVEKVDETFVLEALTKLKEAQKDAISAKAPSAASEKYNEGEKLYSQGLEEYTNGNLDKSYEFYILATKAYRKAIVIANEQKELALAALANAEAAISRTELNAENAIAEGMEETVE